MFVKFWPMDLDCREGTRTMEELLTRIAATEDDDEPSVGLSQIAWQEQSMKMEVILAVKYPRLLERWEIRCERLHSHRISNDYGWPVLLLEDHPVLWPHQHGAAEAFFYGTPQSAEECVGALYAAHLRAVGEWIDFAKFFNAPKPLATMLKSGGGMLARGPSPLMEVYKGALQGLGLEVDIRLPRPDKVPELRALIIGTSYFVGSGWSATRLNDR
jgi:hypothetical protein